LWRRDKSTVSADFTVTVAQLIKIIHALKRIGYVAALYGRNISAFILNPML
jgi:hypothetical protein